MREHWTVCMNVYIQYISKTANAVRDQGKMSIGPQGGMAEVLIIISFTV